jgi:hypothetical protein
MIQLIISGVFFLLFLPPEKDKGEDQHLGYDPGDADN